MTASGANEDHVGSGTHRPCGYARYAGTKNAALCDPSVVPTAGKTLDQLHGYPNMMLITVETKDIRWTDDTDTDPSSTVGHLIPAGTGFEFTGDISRLRWIETSASAVVHISYYQGAS